MLNEEVYMVVPAACKEARARLLRARRFSCWQANCEHRYAVALRVPPALLGGPLPDRIQEASQCGLRMWVCSVGEHRRRASGSTMSTTAAKRRKWIAARRR